MGADNFLNNNGFNSDEARYDRQNRLNPPEFAPGQGGSSEDDLFKSDFETPVSGGGMDAFTSSGNDVFSSIGTTPNTGMAGAFGLPTDMNSQQQQQVKSDDEKFWDAMSKGGKGLIGFFSDLVSSSKGLTPKFISVYGKNCSIASLVTFIAGLLLRLFGVSLGTQLMIGGLVAGIPSILLLMFFVEKGATYSSQYKDENDSENFNQPLDSLPPEPNGFEGLNDSDLDFDRSDSISDDEDDFGDGYTDEDTDFNWGSDDYEDTPEEGEDIEQAVAELPDVTSGMYTRQFLYELFNKVLPSLKSNFAKVTIYDEDDDVFLSWDDIIQRASAVTGLKDDDIPYLKELEENLFTIKATISRPSRMKPELVADEVAKAYAYNTYEDDEDKARVFAKVETVLDDCVITVFTGASHMISLKDMYKKCEEFILNQKNAIPVVLGVNEKGKVIHADFKKIESIIIAGMPRSGKSWLVQAILTQMCALMSPKDLWLFFLDPKAGTSDFKSFKLPHVKKFASRYTDSNGNDVNKDTPSIMDTLRWIVNVEAPRRKRIIGDHNCVNINDFRSKYPDIELPLIYIVIDEMVTLSKMEKELEKEYQSYLDMIVTQFPNLGIKGMFIPHEVKNQIISKTAYDSIKARISVKGSPEHIEASTGAKPKVFPYKLANIGDMAVNIDSVSVSTLFVHGVALTDENYKNMEVFDYLRRIWTKYEPDTVKDSVASSVEAEAFNNNLLAHIDDDEDLGFLEDTSDSSEVFSNPNNDGISGFNAQSSVSTSDDFLSDL